MRTFEGQTQSERLNVKMAAMSVSSSEWRLRIVKPQQINCVLNSWLVSRLRLSDEKTALIWESDLNLLAGQADDLHSGQGPVDKVDS
jgi:hypothetical protein